MKILQVIYSLGNGGAEKFVVELSNELAKSNEVTLCSVRPIEDWMLPPKKISKTVKVIELKIDRKYSLVLWLKLARLIKGTGPDVVHIHSSILVFYLYLLSAVFHKVHFLQTVHNTITPGYVKLFGFLEKYRFLNPRFLNVSISKSIEHLFKARFPKLRYAQIDNGIEKLSLTDGFVATKSKVEGFKRDKDTKVFIAIGNYSSFKNFSMLAEVFTELNHEKVNAVLLLLGGGNTGNQKNYEDVANKKSGNTHQLGVQSNIADYLNCSDALIMSSTKEGMPLVVLEALSAEIPVISTTAGGVVDIVENGVNGLIAHGFEKKDLIEAINTFLALPDRKIREIKENNQKKYVEQYSIAYCAKKYIELAYSHP